MVGVVAQRLSRPVATNLRVRASGVQLHAIQPTGRLDLFAGQELTVLARYRRSAIPMGFGQENGGRITITWYDDEDLGRLVDRLAAVDR